MLIRRSSQPSARAESATVASHQCCRTPSASSVFSGWLSPGASSVFRPVRVGPSLACPDFHCKYLALSSSRSPRGSLLRSASSPSRVRCQKPFFLTRKPALTQLILQIDSETAQRRLPLFGYLSRSQSLSGTLRSTAAATSRLRIFPPWSLSSDSAAWMTFALRASCLDAGAAVIVAPIPSQVQQPTL